ncbi:MAG: ATP-binding protein [Micrococcaceae bacterium]
MTYSPLHRMLGYRSDHGFDIELIEAAVNANIRETDDLDWKSKGYDWFGKPTEGINNIKNDLIKDISAIANTNGGLIILGVRENEKGTVLKLTPVTGFNDETERNYRKIIGSRISPPIQNIQFHPIPTKEEGSQVVVIEIPKSLEAPHMANLYSQSGGTFFYRNGSMNTVISEPQLAEKYKKRFQLLTQLEDTQTSQFDKFVNNRLKTEDTWLIASVMTRQIDKPYKPLNEQDIRLILVGAQRYFDLYIGENNRHNISNMIQSSQNSGVPRRSRRSRVFRNIFADGFEEKYYLRIYDDGSIEAGLKPKLLNKSITVGTIETFVASIYALNQALIDFLKLYSYSSVLVDIINPLKQEIVIKKQNQFHQSYNGYTITDFETCDALFTPGADEITANSEITNLVFDVINQCGCVDLELLTELEQGH